MKKLKLIAVLYLVALGLALNGVAQPADDGGAPPPAEELAPEPPAAQPPPEQSQPEEVMAPLIQEVLELGAAEPTTAVVQEMPQAFPAEPEEPNSFVRQGTTPPRYVAAMAAGGTNAQPAGTAPFNLDAATASATPANLVVGDGERGIRLNFRNVQMDQVLSYLSGIAGFTITSEVDVRGRISVWSEQPVTRDEAVELLSSEMAKQGFAVVREGKLLNITTQTAAVRASMTPVVFGGSYTNIPKDQQIITQIVPVRFINATQLAQDLSPLMPSQMTMTANAGGNALLFTGMRRDIRRLVEIINALDTSVSSLSSVKVFALEYADAKDVATLVKELFAGTESGAGGGGGGRGGGRGGGLQGMLQFVGGAGGGATATTGRPGASRVVATADERSNSLVVSAPEELMLTIERLVASMDINVDDLTVVRLFKLKFADPQETCDMLATLFPDPTTQTQAGRGGRGGGGMFAAANTAGAGQSNNRARRQSKVVAAPDLRTGSVVVTATPLMMAQIEPLILGLDADNAREKKVFAFKIENTDPTTVKDTLDAIFSGSTTANNRSRTQTGAGSQMNQRATQQNQQRTGTTGRTGGTTGRTGGTGATFGGN